METLACLVAPAVLATLYVLMLRAHAHKTPIGTLLQEWARLRMVCLFGPLVVLLIVLVIRTFTAGAAPAVQIFPGYTIGVVALFALTYAMSNVLLSVMLNLALRRRLGSEEVVTDAKLAESIRKKVARFRWLHRLLLARSRLTVEELLEKVCGPAP